MCMWGIKRLSTQHKGWFIVKWYLKKTSSYNGQTSVLSNCLQQAMTNCWDTVMLNLDNQLLSNINQSFYSKCRWTGLAFVRTAVFKQAFFKVHQCLAVIKWVLCLLKDNNYSGGSVLSLYYFKYRSLLEMISHERIPCKSLKEMDSWHNGDKFSCIIMWFDR